MKIISHKKITDFTELKMYNYTKNKKMIPLHIDFACNGDL